MWWNTQRGQSPQYAQILRSVLGSGDTPTEAEKSLNIEFGLRGRSGGLTPLGTTATTSLVSPSGKYTLRLDVSQLGRATLCVPTGQPAMTGFDPCS